MIKSRTFLALATTLVLGWTQPAQAAGGWLGVHPEQPRGIQVGDIIKDSPADKSGLQRGDLLLRLNERDLVSVAQFSMEIYRLDPGTEVTFTLKRNGETMEIKTQLEPAEGHSFYMPGRDMSRRNMPGRGMPGRDMSGRDMSGRDMFGRDMFGRDMSRLAEQKSPLAFNRTFLPSRQPRMGRFGLGHRHDYKTRLKSARSMLGAYERIAEEKQLGEEGKKTSRELRAMLNQAQELFNQYQINEGMAITERAYVQAQDALIGLRKGETLYHSLSFPTPEAEYVYELGSNNVFQMLLKQALNAQSVPADSMAQIEEARILRSKAEENALKNEFKTGIGQLEQSTSLLVELLRKAGLDIP